MTQNLGKLKIIQNKPQNMYSLWRTNEQDEWERYDTYPTIPMYIDEYYDCDIAVNSDILTDIMKLVNEGYTFQGTEIIEGD